MKDREKERRDRSLWLLCMLLLQMGMLWAF